MSDEQESREVLSQFWCGRLVSRLLRLEYKEGPGDGGNRPGLWPDYEGV